MKNMLKMLVIALTVLAFSGVSFAADTATKANPKARAHRCIPAVDAKAGTLSVKTNDKDLDLTASTKGKGATRKSHRR